MVVIGEFFVNKVSFYGVEVLYVFYVSVAGVINYQNFINIAKVCSDAVFAEELRKVCIF